MDHEANPNQDLPGHLQEETIEETADIVADWWTCQLTGKKYFLTPSDAPPLEQVVAGGMIATLRERAEITTDKARVFWHGVHRVALKKLNAWQGSLLPMLFVDYDPCRALYEVMVEAGFKDPKYILPSKATSWFTPGYVEVRPGDGIPTQVLIGKRPEL